MYRYFKIFAGVSNGSYWQSKGLSNERINFITVSNYSVAPFLDYYDTKTRVESSGSCLKQYKIMYTHGKIVNTCIVYEIKKALTLAIIRP